MKNYRPIFVFDLTEKTWKDEKEFSELVKKYPTQSCVFVTGEQKNRS